MNPRLLMHDAACLLFSLFSLDKIISSSKSHPKDTKYSYSGEFLIGRIFQGVIFSRSYNKFVLEFEDLYLRIFSFLLVFIFLIFLSTSFLTFFLSYFHFYNLESIKIHTLNTFINKETYLASLHLAHIPPKDVEKIL